MGQVVLEVERCAGGHCQTIAMPHAGGTVHRPLDILAAIEKGSEGMSTLMELPLTIRLKTCFAWTAFRRSGAPVAASARR